MELKQFSLRLPRDLLRWFGVYCAQKEVSKAKVLRECIEQLRERKEDEAKNGEIKKAG